MADVCTSDTVLNAYRSYMRAIDKVKAANLKKACEKLIEAFADDFRDEDLAWQSLDMRKVENDGTSDAALWDKKAIFTSFSIV